MPIAATEPPVEEPNNDRTTQEPSSQDVATQTEIEDTPQPLATESQTPLPEPTVTEIASPEPTSEPIPNTPVPAISTSPEEKSNIQSTKPISPEQSQPPTRLEIPQIELTIPIVPMGWQVATINGEQTTEWIVPDRAAGWHVNSANAGTLGNVILSGQQQIGEAVFADIAIGEVQIGQTILLFDGIERTFVYQVVDITPPILVAGATPGEEALAQFYMSPSTTAKLTLITGWPDFTTTHRLFVVAEFIGVLDE